MNKSIYYVYALIDPIKDVPFYIGKGCKKRALSHLRGNAPENKLKNDYIARLQSKGIDPEILFLKENLDETYAYSLERIFIKKAFSLFPDSMTNNKHASPGHISTDESKAKLKETYRLKKLNGWKRKPLSSESSEKRKKTLEANKKNGWVKPPVSEEQKKAISIALTGRKISEEQAKRTSATLKRRGEEKWSHITYDLLYDLYINKQMIRSEISAFLDIKEHTIKKLIKKHGISKKSLTNISFRRGENFKQSRLGNCYRSKDYHDNK